MAGRSRAVFGLVIALAALAISSCGSTKTSTATNDALPARSSGGSPVTQAQFIAQASVICHGASTQEQPLERREQSLRRLSATAAEAAFVSLARDAATIARSTDDRLRALPRPPADEQTIGQLVQAYSEQADDASNIATAATHQEGNIGEEATATLARSIAAHQALAKRLGMGECFTLG